jgi:hypothetical protein
VGASELLAPTFAKLRASLDWTAEGGCPHIQCNIIQFDIRFDFIQFDIIRFLV